jgi:hypothetical protein
MKRETEGNVFDVYNYTFINDLEGLMLMGDSARERIVESIREQIKIRPGDEKRWESDELPLVRKLCASLVVKFKDTGDLSISPGDTSLEHVFLSLSRGSSWFSSVDIVEAVGRGIGPKT